MKSASPTVSGANFASLFPSPMNGATVAPSGGEAGKEIELSAEVQPAPKVTSLENFSGSIAGGTKVTINGTDLNGASEVKFGKLKAASFTATSETKISAVAPKTNTGRLRRRHRHDERRIELRCQSGPLRIRGLCGPEVEEKEAGHRSASSSREPTASSAS